MARYTPFLTGSILFVLLIAQVAAEQHYEPADIHLKIELMRTAEAPQTVKDRVIFSYSSPQPTRRVGIAFLHEDFRQVHTFMRNPNGVFLLLYRPPEEVETLVYRMVVDGLWMEDPMNEDTMVLPPKILCSVYEPRFYESVKADRTLSTAYEKDRVTFRYPGADAGYISVAGSFNHWDPYMYRLSRAHDRGELYSFSLSLPAGVYYYYYVVDGKRVPDPTNPRTARKDDGTVVSVLEVQG